MADASAVTGTIKVAMLVDDVGAADETGAEERALYLRTLKRWLPRATVTTYIPPGYYRFEEHTDILVFDYGGMSMAYTTRAWDATRATVSWAQDHPSALVLVPSTVTWERLLRAELKDQGLFELPNIHVVPLLRSKHTESQLPSWWVDAHVSQGRNP